MLNYDTLYNNPVERRRITHPYVWWDNAFSNEQLNLIEEICDKEQLDDAVITGDEGVTEFSKSIRESKIKFIGRNEETDFIFTTLNYVAQSLNNQFYNFNLNGYKDFQYTVYDSEYKGKYRWHMDTILGGKLDSWESETRKLTMILLLSDNVTDFTGGELQLNLGSEAAAETIDINRGRIVAFPSFMIHQVKPVLTGTRKSIVVWIEGPKFI